MPIRLVIVPIIIAQTRPSARSNPPVSVFTFGGICTKLRADTHLESPASHRKTTAQLPFPAPSSRPHYPKNNSGILHFCIYCFTRQSKVAPKATLKSHAFTPRHKDNSLCCRPRNGPEISPFCTRKRPFLKKSSCHFSNDLVYCRHFF